MGTRVRPSGINRDRAVVRGCAHSWAAAAGAPGRWGAGVLGHATACSELRGADGRRVFEPEERLSTAREDNVPPMLSCLVGGSFISDIRF